MSRLKIKEDDFFVRGYMQRKSIAAFWVIEFRQPVTEVDDCNIAEDLFISQMYNVKPELKLHIFTAAEAYLVQPKLLQYGCCLQFCPMNFNAAKQCE